jgi:hypothetical protein
VAATGRTKNPKITADPVGEFFHGLAERGREPSRTSPARCGSTWPMELASSTGT